VKYYFGSSIYELKKNRPAFTAPVFFIGHLFCSVTKNPAKADRVIGKGKKHVFVVQDAD
jgi:hypothetical protein